MFKSLGNKESLSIKIANEIESAISSRKLKEGDRLPSEFELCGQFGVSRTSVREALRMLSAKGLLSIEKGKGVFIKKVTLESVTDPLQKFLDLSIGGSSVLQVVEARKTIEPGITRLAAVNRTDADIDIIKSAIKEMSQYQGDPAGLARLDMNFHMAIAKATKNQLLSLVLKPIFKLMPEIKSKIIKDVPHSRDDANKWHKKILDAIVEGNAEKAFTTMQKHLNIAHEHAKQMIEIEGKLKK
jgi:GntR family transcriptional repressor for pyruvate dehydrogenase complex